MKAPSPLEIETDIVRNLTRLSYFGTVTADHMAAGIPRIEIFLGQMQEGFTVLVDLSGLELMEPECVPHLTKIMDRCKAHGIGTVIRVIPDPAKDIGFNILSLIHYRDHVGIVTCATRDEAEKLLARSA